METDASLAPARPLPAERPGGGPAPGTTGLTPAIRLELCLTEAASGCFLFSHLDPVFGF